MSRNPVAEQAKHYIDSIIENAKKRRSENQFLFCVGDTVECVFADTPRWTTEYGIVIRVESDQHQTSYTVLPLNGVDYGVFTNDDYGHTIKKAAGPNGNGET